ncbi:fructose-1,6-bisphosphatase [Akkermansiaceae bacterium]|nr:fructose-1,6-bisphosphatase [Akkermansiaceae bacterium]
MNSLINQILSKSFPTLDLAAFEVAALSAQLELPKGVIHVISDVHGEDKKLRHVINNASGRLRPLVNEIFGEHFSEQEKSEFLNVLYYPTELIQTKFEGLDNDERLKWVKLTLQRQFMVIRELVKLKRRKQVKNFAPKEFRELFEVLLNYPAGGHHQAFLDIQLEQLVKVNLDKQAIRAASRFIRNIAVEELIVAGDLGDRGARIDKVISYLMHQPAVSIIWGNHDVLWMGACLGQRALIATVLRVSLRYRRIFQIEEGYGIMTKALERLASIAYKDDPALRFTPKRAGEREEVEIARMQKAISIIQFKLEGELVKQHPEWGMDDRNVLEMIDYEKKVFIDKGVEYELLDTYLPTVNPSYPNQLSEDEIHCLDTLVDSFVSSPTLWQHMLWITEKGSMCEIRDKAVLYHACLTLDEKGDYTTLEVDGENYKGVEQLGAFNTVIKRAFRAGYKATEADKDWFYYLWAGPKSPLFGKDKMATFERYFVADKSTHVEKQNPYFEKMHDYDFCDKVCKDLGVIEGGLIVNGHVPVKIEKGEVPIKKGGNAVTIDGAFSEAYGDRGYTLILSPESDQLAEHHGFKDPMSVVRTGEDIIPKMHTIRTYDKIRLIKDTEEGENIRQQIEVLNGLIEAYTSGELAEPGV